MKDERIEQVKNKIRSEMTVIILCGVAISFLVKNLVFNMSIRECITEYLILILSPLYYFMRVHMLKVSIYSDKKSVKNLVMTLIFLVVASVAYFINSKRYNSNGSIIFLPIFLAFFIAILFTINKYNKRRGSKYEEEFDDDKKDN